MSLERNAAMGALFQAAHFVITIILLGMMASEGIAATNNALYDPQVGLAYALRSHTLTYFHLSHLLLVVGVVPVVLLFYERLSASASKFMFVATFAGLAAALLSFLSVLPGFLFKFLAPVANTYPAEAQSAYLAIILLSGAFLRGGSFLYGWWILFSSKIALQVGMFPKVFNWLGMLIGLAAILSLFITQLDIFGLVGVIWLVWLSAILLRL